MIEEILQYLAEMLAYNFNINDSALHEDILCHFLSIEVDYTLQIDQ